MLALAAGDDERKRIDAMQDSEIEIDAADEEILAYPVSDEALESALGVLPGEAPTLLYGSYCFTCVSEGSVDR